MSNDDPVPAYKTTPQAREVEGEATAENLHDSIEMRRWVHWLVQQMMPIKGVQPTLANMARGDEDLRMIAETIRVALATHHEEAKSVYSR